MNGTELTSRRICWVSDSITLIRITGLIEFIFRLEAGCNCRISAINRQSTVTVSPDFHCLSPLLLFSVDYLNRMNGELKEDSLAQGMKLIVRFEIHLFQLIMPCRLQTNCVGELMNWNRSFRDKVIWWNDLIDGAFRESLISVNRSTSISSELRQRITELEQEISGLNSTKNAWVCACTIEWRRLLKKDGHWVKCSFQNGDSDQDAGCRPLWTEWTK